MNKLIVNKLLLEQIIKEELLAATLNKKIVAEHKRLVSERKDYLSMIAEEYMKMERAKDFDVSTLEEGIWDSIKYYIAKHAGSLEKGGKIGGDRKMRHVQAVDKLEAAIEKAGGTVVNKLRSDIEQNYKEFPNMKNQYEFLSALQEIAVSYDTIDKAVQEGKMTADAANGVVEALREYVKYLLDYQLADIYKHFNEEKQQFTKRGAQGDSVDSATLAGLDSNKLPVILGLSGAAATLAALLLKSGWALSLLTKAKAGGAAAKGPVSTITTKLTPKAGEGFTQMLGRIAQGNPNAFGPNVPPGQLFKAMQSLGINPTNPTELFSLGVDPAAYKAAIRSGATTIGDMFPASNQKLFLQKGASAVATLTKALGTATLGTGGAAVAAGQLAAASVLASTLGVGLATAGAAVKLIRMKGKKSSRAQLLRDLSTELQPFENTVVVDPPGPPVEPGPEPVEPGPEPEEETQVSNDPIPLFDENDTAYLRARISQSLKSQGIERDGALRGVINNIIKDLANQLQNNKLTVKEAMVFGDSYLEEEEQLLQEKDYINLYKDAYKLLHDKYKIGQDTIKRIFRTMDRTQAMSSTKTSTSYRNDKSLELTKALLKKLKVKGPEDSAKLKKKLGKIFRERGGLERVFSEMGVGKTKTGGYVTSQEGRIDVGRAIGGKLKTYLSAPRFNYLSAQEKQKIIKTVIMMSKKFLNKEFTKRNIEDIKINETLQRWQKIAGIIKG